MEREEILTIYEAGPEAVINLINQCFEGLEEFENVMGEIWTGLNSYDFFNRLRHVTSARLGNCLN